MHSDSYLKNGVSKVLFKENIFQITPKLTQNVQANSNQITMLANRPGYNIVLKSQ